jgi:hypothetical protein
MSLLAFGKEIGHVAMDYPIHVAKFVQLFAEQRPPVAADCEQVAVEQKFIFSAFLPPRLILAVPKICGGES